MRRPWPGGLDEADVALDRVQAHAFDAHLAAPAAMRQRDEVAGGRGVGLDMDAPGDW
jgi:hypothetical protein